MHRLYHLHILHYHFALCTFITHTHTSTRPLSCTTHPHKHKNIIYFFFCTIHTSCTLCTTFLVDINTDTINAHCNICIISVYTPLPVNMFFPMCIVFLL